MGHFYYSKEDVENPVQTTIQNTNPNYDVNEQIKQEFKSSSKSSKWLLIVLLSVVVIFFVSVFFFRFWKSSTYWYSTKISSVGLNWKNYLLEDVEAFKIPQEVYDNAWDYPKRSDYITWSKKHVLFIYWDGCPYARAYDLEIDRAFSINPLLNSSYSKDMVKVPQYRSVECANEYCPEIWLENICGANLCILNPVTREVIVDSSQNEEQISILLNAYLNRNTQIIY